MSDDQDPKGISRPQARCPRLFPKWRLSIRGRWAPTAPLCGQCPPTLPRKPPGFIASPTFSGYHTDHEHAATPEFLSAASHRRHLGSGLRRPERRHGLCGPLHVYLRALLYRRPVPHSLHRAAQQAEPRLPRRHQAFEREIEGPALDRRRVLRCDALLRKLFSADRHHVHVRGQGGVHYGLLYHHRPAPRAVLQKTVRPVRLARRGAGHRRPLFSLHYGEPDHPVRRFPDLHLRHPVFHPHFDHRLLHTARGRRQNVLHPVFRLRPALRGSHAAL